MKTTRTPFLFGSQTYRAPGILLSIFLLLHTGLHAQSPQPELEADGSFDKQPSSWKIKEGTKGPAPTAIEDGNRFLQLTVPAGYGTSFFGAAKMPAETAAIRVRFRARCHRNPEPARPAIMFLVGNAEGTSSGKPVKIAPDGQWAEQEVIVRFQSGPQNRHLLITTVASPLAVDIDDIIITATSADDAVPPNVTEP